METERKTRDGWDKAAVIASLLIPITVTVIGILGTYFLHIHQAAEAKHRDRQQAAEAKFRLSQQAAETRGRLYVELQTSREEADSNLRKSMFDTVITTFLKQGSREEPELVLALELLTYNFHEVIDLGPLFKHVEAMLSSSVQKEELREHYAKRLEKAAAEVTDKQLAALKDASTIEYDEFSFDELKEHPEGIQLFGNGREEDTQLAKTANTTTFAKVEVLSVNTKQKELRIHLWAYHLTASPTTKKKAQTQVTEFDIVFKVSVYDFPMIDNTRLANGRRIAVVLRSWEPGRAEVALVCFPGSRASLKEKPYYEELIEQMHPSQIEDRS